MLWGIDAKLKEHTDTVNANVENKVSAVVDHINRLDTDFHVFKLDCLEHRRRAGDWEKSIVVSQQKTEISLENTDRNVQCIKGILETYLPNLKDAEEKRATRHQLKEGALWISAVAGALIVVIGLMASTWAYMSGNLTALVSN